MENNKKIKILVCYHKKDKLFQNDILVPIHCGRSSAFERSKDGILSSEEYNWLLNNTIGDNTGDNISELNREVNEMTALYWAWKNYNKLGNPDFIGLMHYRRFFDFSKILHIHKIFKIGLLNKLGLNTESMNNLFKNYTFISRPSKSMLAEYTHYQLDMYRGCVDFSDKYHPMLNRLNQIAINNKLFYPTNMFIMSKEDFFNMCEEVFPVMFDILSGNRKEQSKIVLENIKKQRPIKEYNEALKLYNQNNGVLPRFTGYIMERILSLYFLFLHQKYNDKSAKCSIYSTNDKCRKKILLRKIFSMVNKNQHHKTITIFGIKFNIRRKTNAKNSYTS